VCVRGCVCQRGGVRGRGGFARACVSLRCVMRAFGRGCGEVGGEAELHLEHAALVRRARCARRRERTAQERATQNGVGARFSSRVACARCVCAAQRRGRTRAVHLGGDVAQVVLVEDDLAEAAAVRSERQRARESTLRVFACARTATRAGAARGAALCVARGGGAAARKRQLRRGASRPRAAQLRGCARRQAARSGPPVPTATQLLGCKQRRAGAPGCLPPACPPAPSSRASGSSAPPRAARPAPAAAARRAGQRHKTHRFV
jgi:hypothetical protein